MTHRPSEAIVRWGTVLGLLSALLLAAIKIVAFRWTNSLAVLSDLFDSAVNITSAIAVLVAIRVANRPADADHPYGHHKVENLATIFEAALILLVAGSFVVLAVNRMKDPVPLERLLEGAILEGVVAAGTAVTGWLLLRIGRRHQSTALVADGRHLMADVITTVAVFVGVVLVQLTHIVLIDTLLTLLITGYLVLTAISILIGAVRPLLDEALPPHEVDAISSAAATHLGGARLEQVRTRRSGRTRFIDATVVFPVHVSLLHAHTIANAVEEALREVFADGHVDVQLHLEPPGAHGKAPPTPDGATQVDGGYVPKAQPLRPQQ